MKKAVIICIILFSLFLSGCHVGEGPSEATKNKYLAYTSRLESIDPTLQVTQIQCELSDTFIVMYIIDTASGARFDVNIECVSYTKTELRIWLNDAKEYLDEYHLSLFSSIIALFSHKDMDIAEIRKRCDAIQYQHDVDFGLYTCMYWVENSIIDPDEDDDNMVLGTYYYIEYKEKIYEK